MRDLDSFDRRLLDLVQHDAGRTAEALATSVGLSPSAVQRRLKRLRDDGVIVATVAVVDPRKVGRPGFYIVALEVERERPELIAALRSWLTREERVQQVFYVTGSADFILVVTAPGVEDYEELMSRLLAENANVRRYKTNVALGVHKSGLAIPVA